MQMHVTLCAAMPIHSLQLLPLCDDLRFQKYLSSLHISVGESAYDDVCAFVCVYACKTSGHAALQLNVWSVTFDVLRRLQCLPHGTGAARC